MNNDGTDEMMIIPGRGRRSTVLYCEMEWIRTYILYDDDDDAVCM